MIKKFALFLCVAIIGTSMFSACGSNEEPEVIVNGIRYSSNNDIDDTEANETTENITENEIDEEEYKEEYDKIMKYLELLNVSSDLVGTVHSIIWEIIA